MDGSFDLSGAPEHLTFFPDLVQGSDEWLAARCGLLTASEMKLIVTPTLKVASNEKERAHLWKLLAQRITGHVPPSYLGDDMMRGQAEEVEARILYEHHYAPVTDMGFITNRKFGFTLGCSPDGLVGAEGFIETKSRRQDLQVEAIVEHIAKGEVPPDYVIQVQTAFVVTERKWCDFISFSDGMPMATVRVEPIAKYQDAIIEAATQFEERLEQKLIEFGSALGAAGGRFIPTQRKNYADISL